jgi:hypothetical protein
LTPNSDPQFTIYRANQKSSQHKWLAATPNYWKAYRKRNPEKAERNRKARASFSIAKMDPSNSDNFHLVGKLWLIIHQYIFSVEYLSNLECFL